MISDKRYWKPLQVPSKNPSKKHLLLENLLRSVLLQEPPLVCTLKRHIVTRIAAISKSQTLRAQILKKINLAWNFQSRFNLAWKFQSRPSEFPTKIGGWWVARLKISISLENFKILKFFKIWALRESLATAIATQKNHCDSENTLWSQLFGLGNRQFSVVFIVFQKRHMGLETPQNTLRLQGCDSESQRFFWPNAIFVIATLRFYCDFCGKSLRLRSCDCQSLAICDCDCVGH